MAIFQSAQHLSNWVLVDLRLKKPCWWRLISLCCNRWLSITSVLRSLSVCGDTPWTVKQQLTSWVLHTERSVSQKVSLWALNFKAYKPTFWLRPSAGEIISAHAIVIGCMSTSTWSSYHFRETNSLAWCCNERECPKSCLATTTGPQTGQKSAYFTKYLSK